MVKYAITGIDPLNSLSGLVSTAQKEQVSMSLTVKTSIYLITLQITKYKARNNYQQEKAEGQ